MKPLALDQMVGALDVHVEALAVCEVRAGLQLVGPPTEAIIVHYVLAGTMHLTLEGETFVCPRGSIVVAPPGLPHTIAAAPDVGVSIAAEDAASLGPDGLLRVDAAQGGVGDLRFACGSVSSNLRDLVEMLSENGRPVAETPAPPGYVSEAFQLMLEEVDQGGLGARPLLSALMKTCLVLLIRQRLERLRPDRQPLASIHDRKLRKALKAVLDRPGAKHTVASLAAIAGMSRSCFAKDFAASLGLTPMAFVARTRLTHATRLLSTTQAPVKAVAAMVGFPNRSHFSRAFRQAHGSDPTAFRRKTANRG